MKKIIYIPNQKKECYFERNTPDWEQRQKEIKQSQKLRS